MPVGEAEVQVEGLKALARDLKKSSDPRAGAILVDMREAGREAATPIANVARSAVPHDTDRLSGDIRVTATRTGAAVRMGRKDKVAYAGWIEFGGTRRKPHVSQREFVSGGRYLFPAARGHTAQVVDLYTEAIQRAYDKYNWTNSGSEPGGVHD